MFQCQDTTVSRSEELLEKAYVYVLEHGLGDMSLRPLAEAIGSSPRVLLFLFGSKDELVRALLDRARADELALLAALGDDPTDLATACRTTWRWLADPRHRRLLVLWVEAYGRSLVDPDGPWSGFARATVEDWLRILGRARDADRADCTLALAVLRGALLDLLATGDRRRATAAVERFIADRLAPA